MKAKKQKNGIKVLLSIVVAITMIGMPVGIFVTAETAGDAGNDTHRYIQAVTVNDLDDATEPNAGGDPYNATIVLLDDSFESWPGVWTVGTGWSQNTTVNHTGDACAMRNESSIAPYTPYLGTTQ